LYNVHLYGICRLKPIDCRGAWRMNFTILFLLGE
jgi:hypothetical protein